MNRIASSCLLLLVACLSPASGNESAVVKDWLAAQAGLKSLTADFTQSQRLSDDRRPIVTKGKFAFAAPGSFRWQMGEPAVTLAVQNKDAELVVANVKRKRATIYPQEVLKKEEAAMGFSFIEAGFPRTIAEFNENFTVTGEELKDGIHHVTVKFNSRRVSLGLRKMIFYLAEGSHDLRGFYLRFRDGRSITTQFSNVKKNPGIPASHFRIDLAGYETRIERAK